MALSPSPFALTSDALSNPIGLGGTRPLLRWKYTPTSSPALPTAAFQLQAALDPQALTEPSESTSLLWDSGWKEIPKRQQHPYEGPTPASRTRIWWRVRVRDEAGDLSPWAEAAFFEIGLLERDDWTAHWITSHVQGAPGTCPAAAYFRRSFSLSQPVRHARLYASALGVFECEINGLSAGDLVFAPGWTEYRKRVQTLSLDVTRLLQPGENVLGVILGDGWFTGHLGWRNRQFYGPTPALLMQLEVEYADDTRERFVTDDHWRTTTGPIVSQDFQMGEEYDARLELGKWSSPGYNAAAWWPIRPFSWPTLTLSPSAGPFVRRQEVIALPATPDNDPAADWQVAKRIFDFGQNLVGRARIRVSGPRGVTLQLRHAEILESPHTLHTANLRTARATDHYTLSGEGVEEWEPRFTFHGFRYLEIHVQETRREVREQVRMHKVEAVVLHSDMPVAGSFACSHPMLNQLQSNIVWGQKGNFLEVPTDCPQRDERLGWTGDSQVFIRTACLNRDVDAFFRKWFGDLRDAQLPEGGIPMVVPSLDISRDDAGPAWSDAQIICPWTHYRCYGDASVLAAHYPAMQRYLDHLVSISPGLIRSRPESKGWHGFGDWLALDGSGATSGRTLKDLIGTAFLAHDARLLAEIAAVLGKPEDQARYTRLFEEGRAAFQERFVTPGGYIAGQTQTGYVLALHFELLPETLRPVAAAELARMVKANKTHLATGFVGTPYLCKVLETHGYLDLAWALLEQTTFPSWLFPITNGATTIWERWDSWTPEKGFHPEGMNSFNHYAYGAIGAWMFGTVAGVEADYDPKGVLQIVFRPRPGGTVTWAEARLETPLGRASIRWEKQPDGSLRVSCQAPCNAEVRFDAPPGFLPPSETGAGSFILQPG